MTQYDIARHLRYGLVANACHHFLLDRIARNADTEGTWSLYYSTVEMWIALRSDPFAS